MADFDKAVASLAQAGCTCCDKPLNPDRTQWLEYDLRISAYHDAGGVPQADSQGWFPFGPSCAKRKRKEGLETLRKAQAEGRIEARPLTPEEQEVRRLSMRMSGNAAGGTRRRTVIQDGTEE